MNVVLTFDALADLEQIGRWAGQEYPERGDKLIDLIERRCEDLSDHPRRFPIVTKISGRELRKLVVRRHLVFYELIAGDVRVLRIVHGATNWAYSFAGDGNDEGLEND